VQLEPFAKTLDKPYSTEVGKMTFLEGKTDFSGSLLHQAQSTLLGAFVRRDPLEAQELGSALPLCLSAPESSTTAQGTHPTRSVYSP
jgi:hypothetical protein